MTLQKIIEKLKRKLKEQQELGVPREEYEELDVAPEYAQGRIDEDVIREHNEREEEEESHGSEVYSDEMEFNYN